MTPHTIFGPMSVFAIGITSILIGLAVLITFVAFAIERPRASLSWLILVAVAVGVLIHLCGVVRMTPPSTADLSAADAFAGPLAALSAFLPKLSLMVLVVLTPMLGMKLRFTAGEDGRSAISTFVGAAGGSRTSRTTSSTSRDDRTGRQGDRSHDDGVSMLLMQTASHSSGHTSHHGSTSDSCASTWSHHDSGSASPSHSCISGD